MVVSKSKQHNKSALPSRSTVLEVLRAILLSPEKIRIGMSTDANGTTCYVAVIHRREGWVPLFAGTHIPLFFRLTLPVLLHIDSGSVPLSMYTAEIEENEDPDAWIERHDSETVPLGFTREQLVTAYTISPRVLRSVTAVDEQMRGVRDAAGKSCYCISCIPALQGLAHAWKTHLTAPCFIWKVTSGGSIIASVAEGAVTEICHFWATTGDVETSPAEICRQVTPLMQSMATSSQPQLCYVVPESLIDIISKSWECAGIRVAPPPVLPPLDERYHEAFGNAIAPGTATAQLLSFEQQQTAKKVQKTATVAARVLRYAAAACMGLAIVVAGYIAISRVCIRHDRTAMVAIDTNYANVMATAAKRDSLTGELTRKSSFVAEESAITRLLTELQEVFPEGAAAEEITIAEKGPHSWGVALRAYTHSATLMQPVVTNLQKIRGIQEVRMVYSERITDRKQAAGIRFKIEAVWR